MPITIKQNVFKYKNPTTGQYQSIDAVAETTTNYKSGDTVTTLIRNVGRVVNAGNAIYTSIVLDRPVSVNYANVNITASSSQNVVPVNTSQATGGLSTSTVTATSVSNNIVTVSFPTVNTGLTAGAVYYLELNVTITFN